jgi:urease gamma subunit
LEELVLRIETRDWLCIDKLLEMAKERSSRGVKLSTVTAICSQEFVPAEEVDKLRDHVSRVEYRLDGVMPSWYEASGDLEEADL